MHTTKGGRAHKPLQACTPTDSLHEITKKNRERVREKGWGKTPLVSDVKTYFTSSSAGLMAVKLIFVFNVQ